MVGNLKMNGRQLNQPCSLKPRWALAALLACIMMAMAGECHAVVIFIKGRDEPIRGFLERKSAASVFIDEVRDDGVRRKRSIPLNMIEDIVYGVDTKRLESLDFSEPEAYRRYAEELAEKRQDPEARAVAIRLYLCAAHLDPEKLGRGSMLGLINLARNDLEESKFRAMSYLIDPEHDQRVLTRPDPVKIRPTGVSDQARDRLLKAMKLIRSGRGVTAKQVLDFPEVQEALVFFKELISADEFDRACTVAQVPRPLLEKLVKLELALLPKTGAVAEPATDAPTVSWRQAIRRDGLSPVPVLLLEKLTEFDPSKCHYRDDRVEKWVRPE